MPNIFSNIDKLENNLRNGMPKYNFNRHLDSEEMETFEKTYRIVLPDSYKNFLERFDGGMILEESESFYIDMLDWEPDGPKWSSFYLYTLEELEYKYIDLKSENWLMDEGFKGIYPIIPICNTPRQELLFLVNQPGLKKESPVFSSIKESGKYICTKIADNFNTFLGFYIESDGFPALIPDDIEPSWEVFMKKNNILNIAYEEETYKETIKRITALIKVNPKYSWNYYRRGTAYKHEGQLKLALADFNKAIKVNEKESLFYYCRGILLLDHGSKRKSLIDLDIAVKMDPESKLFITGRANALQKLGKLEKALTDCNSVLDVDERYWMALYVRERVYKAMGEEELALADSDLIDEINN